MDRGDGGGRGEEGGSLDVGGWPRAAGIPFMHEKWKVLSCTLYK